MKMVSGSCVSAGAAGLQHLSCFGGCVKAPRQEGCELGTWVAVEQGMWVSKCWCRWLLEELPVPTTAEDVAGHPPALWKFAGFAETRIRGPGSCRGLFPK